MTPSKPSTSKTPKLSVKSSVRSTAKSSAKAAAQPSDNVSEAATAASSHTSVFNKNVRVIKKYPNRRLYDTTTSSYITLADIKALVMKNAPFVVRDAKTDEDLTRSMLLQIILEAEAGGAPMFTEAVVVGNDALSSVKDEHVRMTLELQRAFGLRREEAIKFIPAYADQGDHVRLKASERVCYRRRVRQRSWTSTRSKSCRRSANTAFGRSRLSLVRSQG